MNEAGLFVIVTSISPLITDRESAKQIIGHEKYIQIYTNSSLLMCEKRDVKGLYEKYKQRHIENLSSYDSKFEILLDSNLIVDTEFLSIAESEIKILDYLILKILFNIRRNCDSIR